MFINGPGLKCFVRKENRSRASHEKELANICKGYSYKKGSVWRISLYLLFFQAYQTQQRFKILTLRGNEKFIPVPTKHADESLPKAF